MMKESKTSSVEMTDLKKVKRKNEPSRSESDDTKYTCYEIVMLLFSVPAMTVFCVAYVIMGFIDPGFVPLSENAYFVPLGIGVIFLCILMIFMLLSFLYMDLEHGALSDLSFSYVFVLAESQNTHSKHIDSKHTDT